MKPDDFTPAELSAAEHTLRHSTFRGDALRSRLAEAARLLAELTAPPTAAALVFRHPVSGAVEAVAVGTGLVAGRGEGCAIWLEGRKELSRRHFSVTPEAGEFVVEDLNSSNGTKIEGAPGKLGRRELRDGDLIAAGGLTFLFVKPE
jgi:hypothetical protein